MSTRNFKLSLQAFLAAAAVSLLGCNGMDSNGGMGTFNLSISDTPVDGATSVLITFTGVEIQPGGHGDDQDETEAPSSSSSNASSGMGSGDDNNENSGNDDMDGNVKPLEFDFPSPMQIDLLKQQGGNSASLLNGVSLPAGHYAWIRLKLAPTNCCTITLSDGSVHPLIIPNDIEGDDQSSNVNNGQSSLKLVHGFTVAAGGTVNFTIDFDLRRSIVLANGQYFLKPVLRITDNEDTGRIHGMVANTFIIGATAITNPACMPAAYVFAGDNVTPVDINPTSAVQPVATATVKLDNDTGNYVYMAGFLAAGDYTVALTCAAGDNPQTVDNLTFSTAKNATVTADMATEVDFP